MLEQGSTGVSTTAATADSASTSANHSSTKYLPLEAPPTCPEAPPPLLDACHWNCEVTAFYQLHLLSLAGGEGLDGSNPSRGAVLGNSGTGPGDDELGSFWELLDADAQPIMPIPDCPESQDIFKEHREMARKYLVLQHEIYNLCKQKTELSGQLVKEEDRQQLHQSRYQDKIMQLHHRRDLLRITHGKLRAQLDRINGADGGGALAPHHQYHQPHHHGPPLQSSALARGPPQYSSPPQYLPYAAPSARPLTHQQTSPLQEQYFHHHHHKQYQHAQPPPSLPSPTAPLRQSSPLQPTPPVSGVPYPALPNASSCSPVSPPYPPLHHSRLTSQHHQQQHRHAHISNLSYTTNPPD